MFIQSPSLSGRRLIVDSLITDSATGVTAFACGIKIYNRGIATDSLHRTCGTVLEAVKHQGYLIEMIVTAKIMDTT